MESAVTVSGFLLLLLSTGVHLCPQQRHEFAHEGGDVGFYPQFSSVDDWVLYRVNVEGDLLLLINCSQPERPQPHGFDIKCDNTFKHFRMSKLTMSQSGDYKAEGWRGMNITEHKSFRLTVCAEGHKRKTFRQELFFGDNVKLCGLDSPLRNGSSLQLYRYDNRPKNYILVLDTNSSLEPLVEDLKGRLQVDLSNSEITLTGVVGRDYDFYCTVWRQAQCQSYSYRGLTMGPKIVLSREEENVTLPCIARGELPDQVRWNTPTGRGRLIINQTHTQDVMYMLNGSQTGDYSLIIPSVSLQHSGRYTCRGSFELHGTFLYVCTKLSPLEVMFSPGQSVLFNITEHIKNFSNVHGIQWSCQKILQGEILIVEFSSKDRHLAPVSLPEDLRGRVSVFTSPSSSSLLISNLTAEDSRVYTWRLYGEERDKFGKYPYLCSEGSFHLVNLHPYGVHSPFYRAFAPLIGCGLLGLVAAVIWFKLRSRRGEQTSGRQSTEGQQSGDEDLHDDMEMAELSTPAVSAGAVEHSV